MTIFGSYASYYDVLYQDKDYESEATFVSSLLRRFGVLDGDVLELGCGTGRHGLLLAGAGYRIDGVDLSPEMLAIAEDRRRAADAEVSARTRFFVGDLRKFSLARRYDAAISLFHVMSYQITDDDLMATLSAVRGHLKPGAPFLFDFWHGPAVASTGPIARAKTMEDHRWHVTRETLPVWHPERDVVEVRYLMSITDKETGAQSRVEECHEVRYLFIPHVEQCLKAAGFALVESGNWMAGCPATPETFSVYLVAVAK